MKKLFLIGIFLPFVLIGCGPGELVDVNLAEAEDDAHVIIRGRTGDTTYQVPVIDVATGAIQTVDTDHHEVHAGDSYHIGDVLDVTNSSNRTFLFVTPDTTKWIHLVWIIHHELEAQVELFEEATFSNNGTALTAYNRDRNSINTAGLLVYHSPTLGVLGTLISNHQAGSGRQAGGDNRASNEWILKQNTNYIIRITNQTNNNNVISSELIWYEHTNRSP